MSNKQILNRNEKINKIRDIIRDKPICMMATNLVKIPFSAYPMTTLDLIDKGDLIFFTSKKATLFKEIEKDNRVQLLYANDVKQEYLTVFSHATHILDNLLLDKLWTPTMDRWFEGKHDPNLVILSVSIVNANYWVSENIDSGESVFLNLQNYGDIDYKADL